MDTKHAIWIYYKCILYIWYSHLYIYINKILQMNENTVKKVCENDSIKMNINNKSNTG